jgi:ATP-dependent RNA helicase DeaD
MKSFSEFGLSAPVLDAVAKMGFAEATPIQEKAIPVVLEGRDLVGQAQAGTGKTAAYGIPIAEKTKVASSAVQAVVLCPTREHTEQVAEELHELCLGTEQKVLPLRAGQRRERQVEALAKGAHVVVGMPSRVRDHLERETLDAGEVRLVVIDEGDMMVDLGQLGEIERIVAHCPANVQLLVFSVTVPERLSELIDSRLKDPVRVSVVAETLTLDETEQIFYEVPEREKLNTLAALIDLEEESGSTVVFCRTRRNVEKVTRKLRALGYEAVGLHSDQSPADRERVAAAFREAGSGLLVTTDVAFRGLELGPVQRLINYHIPQDPAAYLVRVDRMGIAGRSGAAITLVTPAEYFDLLRIQETTTGQLEKRELPQRSATAGTGERGDEPSGAAAPSGASGAAEPPDAAEPVEPSGAAETPRGDETPTPTGAAVGADASGRGRRTGATNRIPQDGENLVADVLRRAGEEAKEGETEAERLQRRHVQKDVAKKIAWTAHEIAMQEAWRIQRERMVHSVHEEAAGVEPRSPHVPPGIAPTPAEDMVVGSWPRSSRSEAQRLVELEERIREAEKLVAETLAERSPALSAEEEQRLLRALYARDLLRGLLDRAQSASGGTADVEGAARGEAEGVPAGAPGSDVEPRPAGGSGPDAASSLRRDLLTVIDHVAESLAEGHDVRVMAALLLEEVLLLSAGGPSSGAGQDGAASEAVDPGAPEQGIAPAAGPTGQQGRRTGGQGETVTGRSEDMARLFVSIGRRQRVSKEELERLLKETGGIQEGDIGRIDLLPRYAFVEVRRAVADRVVERMNDMLFRGREISVEPARERDQDEGPGASEVKKDE